MVQGWDAWVSKFEILRSLTSVQEESAGSARIASSVQPSFLCPVFSSWTVSCAPCLPGFSQESHPIAGFSTNICERKWKLGMISHAYPFPFSYRTSETRWTGTVFSLPHAKSSLKRFSLILRNSGRSPEPEGILPSWHMSRLSLKRVTGVQRTRWSAALLSKTQELLTNYEGKGWSRGSIWEDTSMERVETYRDLGKVQGYFIVFVS